MTANFMIMDVMRAFYWFDEGLQSALKARGWQSISRSQSIMLANIALDIKRPADLARNLGISRQAVSKMLQEMTEDNLLSIEADPNDKRAQIVNFSEESVKLRADALEILGELELQLGKRIGAGSLKAFRNALSKDWGPPPQITIS
ncbi:helix-turn-helix domain-containing protein [Parasphingorhabdus sp. JC815]|uniref:MarR family winged helix-turn-helix transcriptional regulator n=1 Tax=Parasphingorhabdus sp. JC815 TaxID=3232140 RepID=UPI0034582C54